MEEQESSPDASRALPPEAAPDQPAAEEAASDPTPQVSMDEVLPATDEPATPVSQEQSQLKAVLEALVYVTEEPLTLAQLSSALGQPPERIRELLDQLMDEFDNSWHGITIREVAGGYKMATKAEHHEAVRNFVKSLKPPLKLSLPALETLSVIAYKQPVTGPEVMEIRGVQGGGVLKTLLDRKLIAAAGRKNVIGKPILYKTTKEFLIQFGLKDLSELPTLKEFEDLRRIAVEEPARAEAEGADAAAGEASPAAGVDAVAGEPLATTDSAQANAVEGVEADEPAAPAGPVEDEVVQAMPDDSGPADAETAKAAPQDAGPVPDAPAEDVPAATSEERAGEKSERED